MQYNLKTNEVFALLSDYIKSKSKYPIKVARDSVVTDFPCVIFSEISNEELKHSIDRREHIRQLAFQIDIYTKESNGKSALALSEEIKQLVMELMQDYFGIEGGFTNRFFNINNSKALQTTLRFQCLWFVEKNIISN